MAMAMTFEVLYILTLSFRLFFSWFFNAWLFSVYFGILITCTRQSILTYTSSVLASVIDYLEAMSQLPFVKTNYV